MNPFMASRLGRVEDVRSWLDAGGNPNAQGGLGKTSLLHMAAEQGHLAVVDLLLRRGANPNIMSRIGYTPLHHAAMRERLQVADLLLRNDADINAFSKMGVTPSDSALAAGHLPMVEFLKRRGGIHKQPTNGENAKNHRNSVRSSLLLGATLLGAIILCFGWLRGHARLRLLGSNLLVLGVVGHAVFSAKKK